MSPFMPIPSMESILPSKPVQPTLPTQSEVAGLPKVYGSQPPQPEPPKPSPEDKQAEKLRQRIMLKQAALASLGLDWEPDDAEVMREKASMPEGDNLLHLPEPVLTQREYREAPKEQKFAPGLDGVGDEDTMDDLSEEEIDFIKQRRAGTLTDSIPAMPEPDTMLGNKARQSEA